MAGYQSGLAEKAALTSTSRWRRSGASRASRRLYAGAWTRRACPRRLASWATPRRRWWSTSCCSARFPGANGRGARQRRPRPSPWKSTRRCSSTRSSYAAGGAGTQPLRALAARQEGGGGVAEEAAARAAQEAAGRALTWPWSRSRDAESGAGQRGKARRMAGTKRPLLEGAARAVEGARLGAARAARLYLQLRPLEAQAKALASALPGLSGRAVGVGWHMAPLASTLAPRLVESAVDGAGASGCMELVKRPISLPATALPVNALPATALPACLPLRCLPATALPACHCAACHCAACHCAACHCAACHCAACHCAACHCAACHCLVLFLLLSPESPPLPLLFFRPGSMVFRGGIPDSECANQLISHLFFSSNCGFFSV
jgi:hypothetical protein